VGAGLTHRQRFVYCASLTTPAQKGDEIMAKREKEKNGAKLPARSAERSQPPAPATGYPQFPTSRTAEHPLTRLREEIDSLFDRFFRGWPTLSEWSWGPERFGNVDVEETDKEIVVRAEAPGFEPQDFDIHISGNTLMIQAQRQHEAEEKQGEYRFTERRYGRFQRSIPLSTPVDADKVEAHYRNGVLELRLPRTEEIQRRRIEVKT
jgi:HSP20 family protein